MKTRPRNQQELGQRVQTWCRLKEVSAFSWWEGHRWTPRHARAKNAVLGEVPSAEFPCFLIRNVQHKPETLTGLPERENKNGKKKKKERKKDIPYNRNRLMSGPDIGVIHQFLKIVTAVFKKIIDKETWNLWKRLKWEKASTLRGAFQLVRKELSPACSQGPAYPR